MYSFDTFNEIHTMLEAVSSLSNTIGMKKAMSFVHLATKLKDEILSKQKVEHDDASEAPDVLSENKKFMGRAIDLPDKYVHGC
jgi:hypothetical protein